MRYDCPFCHHENSTIYLRNQALREGAFRDIYKCDECGLLYPHPRMDESESLNYLSKMYTDLGKLKLQDPIMIMRNQAVKRWILPRGSHINMGFLAHKMIKQKQNVLDIGTLTGRFCFILQSAGFTAYGLEPYNAAAQLARDRGLNVFTGSFPDDIPEELTQINYSLISMMGSICYICDLKKGLQKICQMLNGDGFLLIQCHQGGSKYYHNGESFFRRLGDNVQGVPTLNALKNCLEKSGFKIAYAKGSISKAVSPFNFDKFSRHRLYRFFNIIESIMNKIYEIFILDINKADQLIVLAQKKKAGCDV